MVGQPCNITRAQPAAYLATQEIPVASDRRRALNQPSSLRPTAPRRRPTSARYFVIHDTSFLHRPGHFTEAAGNLSASINTAQSSGNDLFHANGMTTHVMIARTGLSATSNKLSQALRATKRERRDSPELQCLARLVPSSRVGAAAATEA